MHGGDSRTLDGALREALRSDVSGQLRARVCDLAAHIWWMTCQPPPEAGDPAGRHAPEVFNQLAEALRDILLGNGPADSGQLTQPLAARTADAAPAAPVRLAQARDEIMTMSGGKLLISADSPAELWQQLYLSVLALPQDEMKQAWALLGDPASAYLIPPCPELGIPGLTWNAAGHHKVATQAIAKWPSAIAARYGSLQQAVALTLTLVDLAPNLFMANGQGTTITPLGSGEARHDYAERVRKALDQLGGADPDSPSEVDWLSALDETLRSVFPLPIPTPYSWWARRLDESFELIRACAARTSPDGQVRLAKARVPLDEQQRKGVVGNDNVAILPFRPDEDGQVLWPLRVSLLLPDGPNGSRLTRAGRVVHGHRQGRPYPGSLFR